jgi:hypothetical protein
MKEPSEIFVICKKCGHGAQLYHGGGAIKSSKGAPAVPITGSSDQAKFFGWVVVICKHQQCKNFNKPVFLSEDEFKSLTPPCCSVCKKKMKPERENQGKGNYYYRCENNDCDSDILLADLLPDWK